MGKDYPLKYTLKNGQKLELVSPNGNSTRQTISLTLDRVVVRSNVKLAYCTIEIGDRKKEDWVTDQKFPLTSEVSVHTLPYGNQPGRVVFAGECPAGYTARHYRSDGSLSKEWQVT